MSRFFLVLLLLCISAAFKPAQDGMDIREEKLKAVFVYNFTQFVTWPAEVFERESTPFTIGIIGNETFSRYLKEVVENEKVNGHAIIIKNFDSVQPDINDCQIIFIERSFPELDEVINQTKNSPIMTLSDHESFMEKSGILRFYRKDNKVRFEINFKQSKQAGLEISPKLLRLASIYEGS